jgi:hypothetical protein
MMTLQKSIAFDEIMNRGEITEADVQKFRRVMYADGVIDESDADALFALHRAATKQDHQWVDCFVEMLTDHLVHQATPEGYVTADNAAWLLARIGGDGRPVGRAEFELVINVLDKSRWSPQSLARFALDQVRAAIVTCRGPLRGRESDKVVAVTDADVEVIRRIIYAFGGDGNIMITRPEAEALFEINEATLDATNADSWRDLFVKAIANCVLTTSGYAVPSREQALARDAWLDRRGELSGMKMLKGMFSGYREISREEQLLARLERQKIEIVTGEIVGVTDAAWLAERLGRDGDLSPNENALLTLLKEESPRLAAELQPLLDRLDIAA